MDEKLMKKIKQKIDESISNKEEISKIIQSLSPIDNSKSFALGIIVGRLYNSFYYQTKRILNRDPTDSEFKEFLDFIKIKKLDIENLW
jgi:hypothetical protein